MSFPWLAQGSGRARIKKGAEMNITLGLKAVEKIAFSFPSNLWILGLIREDSKILNNVVLHS